MIVPILQSVRHCLGTPHFIFLFGKDKYQERLVDIRQNRVDKAYYFLSENLVFTMACFEVWQIVVLLSNMQCGAALVSLHLVIGNHL